MLRTAGAMSHEPVGGVDVYARLAISAAFGRIRSIFHGASINRWKSFSPVA